MKSGFQSCILAAAAVSLTACGGRRVAVVKPSAPSPAPIVALATAPPLPTTRTAEDARLSAEQHKREDQSVADPASEIQATFSEMGLASWYGYPYHGRRTAGGEIYDMEQLTAAHRTLPFNTWVRVFDLDNDHSVDVRINDRGPFVDGRVIDLSHAAAQAIQMVGPGIARVRLQVMRLPEGAAAGALAVQVGAFEDRRNAESVRSRMESRYGVTRVVLREGSPDLWLVQVGSEATATGARELAGRIREDSSENGTAFVVRLDSLGASKR